MSRYRDVHIVVDDQPVASVIDEVLPGPKGPKGEKGETGETGGAGGQGPPGHGYPPGGLTGQIPRQASDIPGDMEWFFPQSGGIIVAKTITGIAEASGDMLSEVGGVTSQVTAEVITHGNNPADSSSYTIPEATYGEPGVFRTHVLAVGGNGASAVSPLPTLDSEIAWTLLGSAVITNRRFALYKATVFDEFIEPVGVGYSGVQTSFAWGVAMLANVNLATPFVGSPTFASGTSTGPASVTMPAFASADNAVLGLALLAPNAVLSAGPGFTQLWATTTNNTSSAKTLGEFRPDNDTTVDASFTGGSIQWIMAGLEVKRAT